MRQTEGSAGLPDALRIDSTSIGLDRDRDAFFVRIGDGPYADVYTGHWRNGTNVERVAVKAIRSLGHRSGAVQSVIEERRIRVTSLRTLR